MNAVSPVRTLPSRRQIWGRTSSGRAPDLWSVGASGAPLRVAMLAPPWIPVPAPGYGGVESVVSGSRTRWSAWGTR
jgi:hypothetical protein